MGRNGQLKYNGRVYDRAIHKMKWVREPDGAWDLVLYIRHITPLEDKWIIDSYLESNIPDKEYFIKRLSGELSGT